jgi:hypothetical protein
LKLLIDHTTTYAYAAPVSHALQLVRLFARPHAGLRVQRWRVDASRGEEIEGYEDGLGNLAALAQARGTRAQLRVAAVVDTADTQGWLKEAHDPLPPAYFLRETPLTKPDAALKALHHDAPPEPTARAPWLRDAVRDTMAFQVGATDAETTAAQAFARRRRLPGPRARLDRGGARGRHSGALCIWLFVDRRGSRTGQSRLGRTAHCRARVA